MQFLEFALEQPWWLLALILLPLLLVWLLVAQRKTLQDGFEFSHIGLIKQLTLTPGLVWQQRSIPTLMMSALTLLILSLSGPQVTMMVPTKSSIMMVVFDISISMEATDIAPNRLDAAKSTALDFIKQLPSDVKVGLQYFAGSSFLMSGPTTDRPMVTRLLEGIGLKDLKEGTAIGDALFVAETALQTAWDQAQAERSQTLPNDTPSKDQRPLTGSIVLITDGENNIGVSPRIAAAELKKNNISVFAIGIGESGGAFVRQNVYTRLDEVTLQYITNLTGGQYYRARSIDDFKPIYRAITERTLGLERQTIALAPFLTALAVLLLFAGTGLMIQWRRF